MADILSWPQCVYGKQLFGNPVYQSKLLFEVAALADESIANKSIYNIKSTICETDIIYQDNNQDSNFGSIQPWANDIETAI